jgi:hypothetical protein
MIRITGSIILLAAAYPAFAQPEVMAWGNLTGVRVEGHLLELKTSMCIAQPELTAVTCTGREKQQNTYSRNGKTETVTVHMRAPREFRDPQGAGWMMSATEIVEDTGPGAAQIDLEFSSPADANIGGAFLGIELPASVFSAGSAQLIAPDPPAAGQTSLAPGAADQNEYLRATAKGVRFISRDRQIDVAFDQPTLVIVRDDRRKGNYNLQVLLAVLAGKTTAGQSARKTFAFKVTGESDRNPVEITLDPSRPGQLFDGLGGNFRLQNPRLDPPVIDYNLRNLRVAWGRVEMPWNLWQPDENTDPLAAARAGKVHPRVQQAMEMARRLARIGMPVIVSAWQPPAWAVLGDVGFRRPAAGAPRDADFPPPQPEGPRGNPLNPEKMSAIQDSIAGYLLFLKQQYGVEAALFSFNESDLGINVRQTPREHDQLIKTLGAAFARKGLATKLALGDTSTPTPSISSSPPSTTLKPRNTSALSISIPGADAPTRSSPNGAMPPASSTSPWWSPKAAPTPPPIAIPKFSTSSPSPFTKSISTCASSPSPSPGRSCSGSSPPTIPSSPAEDSSMTPDRYAPRAASGISNNWPPRPRGLFHCPSPAASRI